MMKRIYAALTLLLASGSLFAQLTSPPPVFSKDVAPIMFTHCTTCHRPGSIAPFPLQTYQDAYNNRFSMSTKVSSRIMPPWPANTDFQRYAHERVLSCDEINTIVTWVNNGAPQGDSTLTPPIPTFPSGSTLGTPDLVLTIPTYTIPAGTNGDLYRCFVLPTGLSGTKYITAVEAIPGDRSIVHHALIYQDTTNVPVQLDAADSGPGYTNFGGTGSNKSVLINGWVPGSTPAFLPANMGIKLQAGANIIVQIHYPAGSAGKTDSTKINFFFASNTSGIRDVSLAPILNHQTSLTDGPLSIPANTTKTFHEHFKIPGVNLTALAVAPHMHLIGKKIKAFVVTPTNDTIKLVDIQDWDFHWQGGYNFRNPMKIPANSDLYAEAFYDNTTNNANNPNLPPQDVHLGESTTDEMMLVYFTYLIYNNGDENIVIDTAALADSVCRISYVTGVDEQIANNGIQLFDAVPNPTNGQSNIAFNLPQAGNVDLGIYDLAGRLAVTLLDHESKAAGYNSYSFEKQLPASVYFIRLSVGGTALTKKLVITQ